MKKSNRIYKLFAAVLSALLVFTAFPLTAFAATTPTYNNLEYKVTNGEVTITRYAGTEAAEAVIVPEEINGSPVTAIGDGAFTVSKAKNIQLPKTITKIGMMAFMGSTDAIINLADLEDLTYIGAYAFVDTGLSGDLVLPESVTDIGAGAFSMTDITSLHLGKNVKPVEVQTGKPWNTIVKSVMSSSFASLADSFLKPYSSTESERNIAMNCLNLTKITVDSKNPYLRSYGGVLFSKDMTEMYCYPSGKQMHTYIIPLTVRNFYNSFGGLHLPPASFKLFGNTVDLMDDNGNGLVKLPEWTDFGSNNPLKSVVIPAGVSSICFAAFYNTGLTSVYIPKNVEIIGKKAFWHCRDLVTVGFDRNSVYQELPEQCFKDCESLKNVTFGKVDYLAALAFGNCSTIESIDLTNVRSLNDTAFDDCTNLSEVIYRDTETTSDVQAQSYSAKRFAASTDASSTRSIVSASAFENTASLKTVMLGSSVEKVEAKAFANCANLETVYLSDEIDSIHETAFDGSGDFTIVCPNGNGAAYQKAIEIQTAAKAKGQTVTVTTMVISPIANQTYTGKEILPDFTVTASGKRLTKDVDYEVFYKNNVEAGTASITVVGKGNYSIFAALAKFAILRRDLSDDVLVSNVLPQTANKNGVEPELALSCGDYILQKDVDYTVVYENNSEPGTATATVTGIGNFKGSKTLSFTITATPDTVEVTLPGDIDGDGQLALTDYAFIKTLAIGAYETDDPYILAAADINGDGAVDMFDAMILNQKLNGYA